MQSFLTFRAGGHHLGVEVTTVAGVQQAGGFTADPDLPQPLVGRLATEDGDIPVVDLPAVLAAENVLSSDGTIIVANTEAGPLAFAVERVEDIVTAPDDAILALPPLIQAVQRGCLVRGAARLADRVVLIADLDRVFTRQEVVGFHVAIQTSHSDPVSESLPAGAGSIASAEASAEATGGAHNG